MPRFLSLATETLMNDRVTGLILKQMDYRDHSVILTVLTKEYGKISFVAAGIRKMDSKNAGSVLPYTKAEFLFDYKEDKSMFRMKTASTVSLYRRIHEDLTAGAAASLLAEICDALTLDTTDLETCGIFFDKLEQTFQMLEEGKRADLITALFLADMLNLSGIGPEVDQCVICGRKEAAALSVQDGGFLCSQHAYRPGSVQLSAEELKQFRLIVHGGLAHYDVIAPRIGNAMKTMDCLVRFLSIHAGIELRSYPFFKRVFAIE